MADSTQLFIDIQTNMLKTLNESQKSLDRMGDLLTDNQKKFSGIDKTGEKIVDSYSDIEKHQKSWNKDLGVSEKIIGGLKKALSGLGGVAAGLFAALSVGGAFKDALQINEDMIDISYRMGQSGKSVRALKDAVFETTQTVGLSIEKSSQLVQALGRLRVPIKDMRDLSVATARFEKISGVSTDTAARLTGELSRTGKLGSTAIQSVLLNMVKVQRAVGLTEGEMEQLAETTVKTTQILHQMGKSQGEIERFSKGTAKLAAAFSSVGVNAGDALKVVEDLLDPSKVEDNAFMLSKLGVSMEDAFSGNVDPEELAAKFKDLAGELKGMSIPAANEMAKALGMPLSTLKQMDDMDLSTLSKSLADTSIDAEAAMKAMQGEQAGPQEQMLDTVNKAQAMITETMDKIVVEMTKVTSLLPAMMDKVKVVFDYISSRLTTSFIVFAALAIIALMTIKKKFFETNTSIATNLQNGMVGAVTMGSRKGAEISSAIYIQKSKLWSEDRKKRIQETTDFARKQNEGEYLEGVAKTNTYFKGIINWSAKVAKESAYGGKGSSYLLAVSDSLAKKTRERYQMQVLEGKQIIEMKNERKAIVTNELAGLASRKAGLHGILKSGQKLTEMQKDELININKKIGLLEKEDKIIGNSITNQNSLNIAAEKALLTRMNPGQMKVMRDQINGEKESLATKSAELIKTKKKIMEEKNIADLLVKTLSVEKAILLADSKKPGFSSEQAMRLAKVNEELGRSVDLSEALKKEEAATTQEIKDTNIALKASEDIIKKIDIAGGDGLLKADTGALKQYNSLLFRMGDAGKSLKENMISGAIGLGNKIKNSFNHAKEALGSAIKNAGPYLKQLGGGGPLGLVKGIGVALFTKSTGKKDEEGRDIREKRKGGPLGPLGGILMGFLMKSEGFQKLMQKVMAALQKPINSLFAAIGPMVDPLLKVLDVVMMKIVMPVLKVLAPVLLKFMGLALILLGGILQCLGWVAKKLTGSDSLLSLGKSLSDAGKEIMGATLDFSEKAAENTEAIDKNTEAQEAGPEIISSTGSGFASAAGRVVPPSAVERKAQDTQDKAAAATSQTAITTQQLSAKQDRLITSQEATGSILMKIEAILKSIQAQGALGSSRK